MSGYQTFNFQVTPQKSCCLWPNSKECKNLPDKKCYCCDRKRGLIGRPLGGFQYTTDADRWKVCNKLEGCPAGGPQQNRYNHYGPGGVNNGDGVF